MIEYIVYILSYLIGSIPFGYVLAKYKTGKNIQQEGSGNIGATNVTRVLGKKYGLITLVLDAAKGLLAVFIASFLGVNIYIAGYAAIIGHILPVWLKFRGGKGVATTIAILFYITPFLMFILFLIWLSVFFLSRISSLASIVASLVAPVLVLLFYQEYDLVYFVSLLALTVLLTHAKNISRLILGKELKMDKRRK